MSSDRSLVTRGHSVAEYPQPHGPSDRAPPPHPGSNQRTQPSRNTRHTHIENIPPLVLPRGGGVFPWGGGGTRRGGEGWNPAPVLAAGVPGAEQHSRQHADREYLVEAVASTMTPVIIGFFVLLSQGTCDCCPWPHTTHTQRINDIQTAAPEFMIASGSNPPPSPGFTQTGQETFDNH